LVRFWRKAIAYILVVRRGRYDIVDAWLHPAYVLAVATRVLTRTPIVVTGRRSLSDFKERFGPLQRAFDRIATRWGDAIVANSEAVAADVVTREHLARDRIRVIRNGILPAELIPPSVRAEMRASWGIAPEHVVIGCVANFKPGKGLELLIEAFRRGALGHPSWRLVLVGDGVLRGKLRRLVAGELEERVVLAGSLLNPMPAYGAFDLAVLASDSEGMPNVLLEAGAAGLPLVATDAGGSRELVLDGVTGLLVPVGDVEALAAALERLANDPVLRDRLGRAARERVATTFGMDRMVAEFAALYEELADQRARR
jgi:glycosyltransferase involved in cell wall biosynthesis